MTIIHFPSYNIFAQNPCFLNPFIFPSINILLTLNQILIPICLSYYQKIIQQSLIMTYNQISVVRSQFSSSTTRQLRELLVSVNWKDNITNICKQLNQTSEIQHGGKYVWMVGDNPTYFLQFQINSYAIFKAYDKKILVWKPKYLEYPSVVPFTDFGQNPKIIKSMQVGVQQKVGVFHEDFLAKITEFLKQYYGKFIFNLQEEEFEKNLLTQLKHYVSRIEKDSYWHCGVDIHNNIDTSSRKKFLKIRIKGVKQQYDKDLILFSHQGVRQFLMKGKGFQIVSFLTMLIIFITLVGCHGQSDLAICSYKDQVMLASAAIMMGLMGMRVATRNKFKKKLDKKIAQLEKQN